MRPSDLDIAPFFFTYSTTVYGDLILFVFAFDHLGSALSSPD